MFKIISLILSLVFALTLSAIEPEILQRLDSIDSKCNKCIELKNYKGAISELLNAKKLILSLPDSTRIEYMGSTDMNSNFYYNLSRLYCLDEQADSASKMFRKFTDKAIDNVEININNFITDKDFTLLYNDSVYLECLERLKKYADYKAILKNGSLYWRNSAPESLKFRYAEPNDSDLVRLRNHFNLDSIAGSGDELSKIKNLMTWLHNTVRHDGSSYNPKIKNTISMIELCKKENRGVNCRMLAQMLTEIYLSMGFKARFVTCLPKNYISDCHVITTVYSRTLDKWIWVDPSFDAYLTDQSGTMLSIQEVREMICQGKESNIFLNDYANWNNLEKTTKEHYIDYYMAKNLYYLCCMEWSRFNAETLIAGRKYCYIYLVPYDDNTSSIPHANGIRISDDNCFWQSPF